jgi:hypothetical protein
MGYHVSILRTNGATRVAITLSEAKSLLLGGTDWRFDSEDCAFVARNAEIEGETLWFQDGELWTKSPPDAMLAQMIELAKQLNARVRGDELETYESLEKSYTHPDDMNEKAAREAEAQVLRRRRTRNVWRWRAAVVLLPITVAFVYRWITR